MLKYIHLNSPRVSVALRYDNLFLNNVCGGDHVVAKARAEELLDLAEAFFKMSAALGATVELDIVNIKHVNSEFRLTNGASCNQGCALYVHRV